MEKMPKGVVNLVKFPYLEDRRSAYARDFTKDI
jgi:hypothetical protein